MKTGLRIFKWFSLSLLTLLVLTAGAAALVWTYPSLLLTDSRVNFYFNKYAGAFFVSDATHPFPHLKLELKPYTLRGKHIVIDLDPFCLKDVVDTCVDQFHLEFSVKVISLSHFQIDEIGPAMVADRYLKFTPKKETPLPPKSTASNSPNFLSKIHLSPKINLNSIQINFPDAQFVEGTTRAGGKLSLRSTSATGIQLLVDATEGTEVSGHVDVSTEVGTSGETPFHLLANANLKNGKANPSLIDVAIDGRVTWAEMFYSLSGSIKAKDLIPWITTLELNEIKLEKKKNLVVTSDVLLKMEPKLNAAAPNSSLPKAKFTTNIGGKFNVEQKKDAYLYHLNLGPMHEKGLQFLADLKGVYPFPKKEEYRYGLSETFVQFQVPKFEVLVKALKRTSSAIPAPFHTLKGPIVLQLGTLEKPIEKDSLPIKFTTKLTSPEQNIVTDSEGELTFVAVPKSKTQKIDLKGSTQIQNVTLTLPDIDPLQPEPTLFHDSRIRFAKKGWKPKPVDASKTKSKSAADSNFSIDWKLTTTGPVKVFYPILNPYAPLQLTWNINDQSSSGEIKVLPFEVDYLKRTARLEHFRYYQKPGETIFHYDGRLTVPKTEYTIFIDVYDDEGKPKVTFNSDPPLEQSDIISVLLFNQTSAQLSPDESSSVGQTQSAVANRALGLFSLWALSSTPIEAVSYNAVSHVYSARVHIANGLTATVGTDWDNNQQVALRKRLGKNWVLSTIFQNQDTPATSDATTTTTSGSTETLIQWFRRF
jgi:hypothetical protein